MLGCASEHEEGPTAPTPAADEGCAPAEAAAADYSELKHRKSQLLDEAEALKGRLLAAERLPLAAGEHDPWLLEEPMAHRLAEIEDAIKDLDAKVPDEREGSWPLSDDRQDQPPGWLGSVEGVINELNTPMGYGSILLSESQRCIHFRYSDVKFPGSGSDTPSVPVKAVQSGLRCLGEGCAGEGTAMSVGTIASIMVELSLSAENTRDAFVESLITDNQIYGDKKQMHPAISIGACVRVHLDKLMPNTATCVYLTGHKVAICRPMLSGYVQYVNPHGYYGFIVCDDRPYSLHCTGNNLHHPYEREYASPVRFTLGMGRKGEEAFEVHGVDHEDTSTNCGVFRHRPCSHADRYIILTTLKLHSIGSPIKFGDPPPALPMPDDIAIRTIAQACPTSDFTAVVRQVSKSWLMASSTALFWQIAVNSCFRTQLVQATRNVRAKLGVKLSPMLATKVSSELAPMVGLALAHILATSDFAGLTRQDKINIRDKIKAELVCKLLFRAHLFDREHHDEKLPFSVMALMTIYRLLLSSRSPESILDRSALASCWRTSLCEFTRLCRDSSRWRNYYDFEQMYRKYHANVRQMQQMSKQAKRSY